MNLLLWSLEQPGCATYWTLQDVKKKKELVMTMFHDYVFTKNAPKLPFLGELPNFWKKNNF